MAALIWLCFVNLASRTRGLVLERNVRADLSGNFTTFSFNWSWSGPNRELGEVVPGLIGVGLRSEKRYKAKHGRSYCGRNICLISVGCLTLSYQLGLLFYRFPLPSHCLILLFLW
ncbi:hypothetical protein BT69DRAFT_148529 [Atractiella rhizophila]|nr:hypothetical protein BT69DRAFT_148529 [Atractiella rhizophila]